jgi:hypothetical protein
MVGSVVVVLVPVTGFSASLGASEFLTSLLRRNFLSQLILLAFVGDPGDDPSFMIASSLASVSLSIDVRRPVGATNPGSVVVLTPVVVSAGGVSGLIGLTGLIGSTMAVEAGSFSVTSSLTSSSSGSTVGSVSTVLTSSSSFVTIGSVTVAFSFGEEALFRFSSFATRFSSAFVAFSSLFRSRSSSLSCSMWCQ